MPIEIGYWNLRGLVGFIRLIAEHTGEAVEWVEYDIDNSEKWVLDKSETLPARGFHFPNLPWMADGDLKLTQSLAILKHLASKHNLMVKPEEVATLCMCEQQIVDMRSKWFAFCYGGTETDEEFKAVFQPMINSLGAFIENRNTLGSELSYVDFLAWEHLDHVSIIFPEVIECNPNVLRFYKHFAQMEKIKSYIETAEFEALPLNAPSGRGGRNNMVKRTKKLF